VDEHPVLCEDWLTVAVKHWLWWKNSSVLNGMGGSRKGQKMCKMIQEVCSQQHKGQMQVWTELNLGLLRSKIKWQTNSRRRYKGLFGAMMVPQILTDDRKQCQLHISSDLLHNKEMSDRVITDGEMCFNMAQKKNARAHRIHLGHKRDTSHLQFKTMLVCFFDDKGTVHYESIAQGQTVNHQCYLQMLTRNRFGGKDSNCGLTSGFSTTTPLC
jgi:hypothetical protein